MHSCHRPAFDTRLPRIFSSLVVLAAALHFGGSAHAAPHGPRGAAASAAATQPQAERSEWSTRWYEQAPEPVTGKLTRSPVLGPTEQDGVMGGNIPSALPGWTPQRGDADDAYVYVPGQGWLQGDTREQRQH